MDDIKHIFFDLDHTLWDFESNSRAALSEIFESFALSDKLNVNESVFIDRYELHNDRYWKMYRENRISKSRLRNARFEAVLLDFRVSDKALTKAIGDAYVEISPLKTQLFDGAIEVLNVLSNKYALHILTNGFEEVQFVKIKSSGIDGYFTEIITSEMAKAKKPNQRIFQVAMNRTGAAKHESLMIGDNLEIDVKGAKSAGWQAIHFNPKECEPTMSSIKNLRELIPLLT